MHILSGKKLKAITQENTELKNQYKNLSAQVALLDSSILTWTENRQNFRGTKYNSYDAQISAANLMYNGTAYWGVNQIAALVQARIGFIMPKGFKIIPKVANIDNELKFIKNFIEFNGLAKENIYHFLSEGELDGKVLFWLKYDTKIPFIPDGETKPATGMTSVRYISQLSKPYKVNVDPNDYMLIKEAVWKDANSKEHSIKEPDLVYRKFGGRLDNANETSSKILKVLTQIEDLDRALRDWREMDHLFATPIPDCEVENAEDATNMATAFNKANFKAGKMFFHTGKLGYAQPTMSGAEMLYKEIVVLAEMISFNTGVPVHYWFPELATNRATAEDISYGLINSATSRERNIWEGLLEEMINKAIAIYNVGFKLTPLRQGVVTVQIPVLTKEDWERFTATWLPLFNAKGITLRTLLSKLPDDLDVEKEIEEVQAEKDAAFERMKENGLFQAQLNQDEEDEDGGKGNVGNFGKQAQKEKA